MVLTLIGVPAVGISLTVISAYFSVNRHIGMRRDDALFYCFLIHTLAFVMQHKSLFAFTRINFLLLGIALVTIFIGFILMSGSGSTDTEFNPRNLQHASHSSGADGLLRGLSIRDCGHPLSSEEGQQHRFRPNKR